MLSAHLPSIAPLRLAQKIVEQLATSLSLHSHFYLHFFPPLADTMITSARQSLSQHNPRIVDWLAIAFVLFRSCCPSGTMLENGQFDLNAAAAFAAALPPLIRFSCEVLQQIHEVSCVKAVCVFWDTLISLPVDVSDEMAALAQAQEAGFQPDLAQEPLALQLSRIFESPLRESATAMVGVIFQGLAHTLPVVEPVIPQLAAVLFAIFQKFPADATMWTLAAVRGLAENLPHIVEHQDTIVEVVAHVAKENLFKQFQGMLSEVTDALRGQRPPDELMYHLFAN
eukprot:TRINITY_DN10162_c0_g1_i12.p1 TRINITY_DN10162_c0_g1~~TRINITY_DN10162_c0_g1_i12.p1  ORF type:complete len:283 (+),score=79.81 TRINITY_DN10162_c0_g1_i12:121-969(+)